jgi:hypothetical protein
VAQALSMFQSILLSTVPWQSINHDNVLYIMVFFLKKYSDFGGGKKINNLIQFLSYNLMLNSGKKICALHDKKINILTLVLSEKKILNETKNHNPPAS